MTDYSELPPSQLQDKLANKLLGTKVDAVFVQEVNEQEYVVFLFDNGQAIYTQEFYLTEDENNGG